MANLSKTIMDAMSLLNQSRLKNILCDITIVVEGREFRAHKIILAVCSPYFMTMLTSGFEESHQAKVVLNDLDHECFNKIVNYAYKLKLPTVTDKNVRLLLKCASILQVAGIQDHCYEYLQSRMDNTNCLGIQSIANFYSCKMLQDSCDNFIEKNFEQVSAGEEFLEVEQSQLIEIIKKDGLQADSEEAVYEAVMRWIGYKQERIEHIPNLLNYIRFAQMESEYLSEVVSNDPHVKTHLICRQYIDEAMRYQLGEIDERITRFCPRRQRLNVRSNEWIDMKNKSSDFISNFLASGPTDQQNLSQPIRSNEYVGTESVSPIPSAAPPPASFKTATQRRNYRRRNSKRGGSSGRVNTPSSTSGPTDQQNLSQPIYSNEHVGIESVPPIPSAATALASFRAARRKVNHILRNSRSSNSKRGRYSARVYTPSSASGPTDQQNLSQPIRFNEHITTESVLPIPLVASNSQC